MQGLEVAQKGFGAPNLIVCEGSSDRELFRRIVATAGLTSKFCVTFPNAVEPTVPNGNTGFGRLLTALELNADFRKAIRGVLIVADSDADHEASFAEVCRQVAEAGFAPPASTGGIGPLRKGKRIGVATLPVGRSGSVETYCVEASLSKWSIRAQLDDYIAKVPASGWAPQKLAKARLQMIFASVCEKKPDASLKTHWQCPDPYHLPVSDVAFAEVVEVFASFAAGMQGGE